MPKINHINFGDIQKHEYLTATVRAVYPEDNDTSPQYWDTADVYIDELGISWNKAPIFYHCTPNNILRNNGAVNDGALGFAKGDKAIVLCTRQTVSGGQQSQESISSVKIIGHADGIKKCCYNYVLVRASLDELGKLVINADEEETQDIQQYCTIFDVRRKALAKILNPDYTGEGSESLYIEFPCEFEKIKAFLQYVEVGGCELFEQYPQGDNEIQVAGCVPNWKTDLQGEHIRNGIDAKEWWISSDINANPVLNFFEDAVLALMTDEKGAVAGTYQLVIDILDKNKKEITKWNNASPAFEVDKREYAIHGPGQINKEQYNQALDTQGQIIEHADSYHIQTAFGEDEIWLCGVDTCQGLIMSYCDAPFKFFRISDIPPTAPVIVDGGAAARLANTAELGQALPGSIGANTGSNINDMNLALAQEATYAGLGGENSIWSYATLKRINEGRFHRTIHPAMSGSMAVKTTPIPESEDLTTYLSALNYRWDKIDIFYRYDNWQNALEYSCSTYGVDRTWWFRNAAQQWGCETIYFDTPIGSMWFQAPNWQCTVWYLYAFQFGSSIFTARKDKALHQKIFTQCQHNRNLVCQLYIAQRTSVTLWTKNEDMVTIQKVGVDPFSCIPGISEEELKEELTEEQYTGRSLGNCPVAYVEMPDGNKRHFDSLTEEELKEVLSDLVIVRSRCDDDDPDDDSFESRPFRKNRNEIEIMGAVDLYADLEEQYENKNPVNQERCPEFEKAVGDLIALVMSKKES